MGCVKKSKNTDTPTLYLAARREASDWRLRGVGRCRWTSGSSFEKPPSDCAALDEPLVVGETRPTTLLFADPPTALAVTAEGASCVAPCACGSFGQRVSCMLAAPRVPTGPASNKARRAGAGREPSAAVLEKASRKRRVCGESCDESAASCASELIMWYRKLTILDFETQPAATAEYIYITLTTSTSQPKNLYGGDFRRGSRF
jgi:hypothetical protein